MRKPQTINLKLMPNAKEAHLKPLGGGNSDEWNRRLNDLTVNALPIAHSKNKEAITTAAVAVCRGTMDIAPADPVEGILIAQLMAANEASLAMYSKPETNASARDGLVRQLAEATALDLDSSGP